MNLTSNVSLGLTATLSAALAIGTAQYSPGLNQLLAAALANGTGADNARYIYAGQNTLAAGATEDFDVYAPGADPLGNVNNFSKVRICIIQIIGDGTNNFVFTDADTLTIGNNATAAAWLGFFATNTDKVTIPSGTAKNPGTFFIFSGGAAGFAVTAGAHLLRIKNNSGTRSLSYNKIIIGE